MKYIKYLSVALVGMMGLTSCSDFLDADNKSEANSNAADYFAKDPAAIIPVAYNSLRAFGVQVNMHDLGSDLYSKRTSSGDNAYAKFEITVDDGTVSSYYSNGYKAINYCNAIMKYGADKPELTEQARFIRSYVYFLLSQQFGGVPYVTYYVEDANRDYPRTPLAELYTTVIEDLEDLYNNSKALPAQSHDGHASKQAVAALLAKYYLAQGWDIYTELTNAEDGTYKVNSTESFMKAAEWSEKAINGIQLTMPFADKWSPFNEGNAEEIFSIQYDLANVPSDPSNSGHNLQMQYTAYFGDCKGTGLKPSKGGSDACSVKSTRLFEKGDLRYDATFMTTYYNAQMVTKEMSAWGKEGYYAYYNCTDAEKKELLIAAKFFPYYTTDAEIETWLKEHKDQIKKPEKGTYGTTTPFAARLDNDKIAYWEFKEDGTYKRNDMTADAFYNRGSGMNGLSVKKFDDPSTPQAVADNCYRDIVLLHVSQMYLVNAEANYMAGNDGAALKMINAVRGRAGLPALGSYGDYKPQYEISSKWTDRPLDLILDEYARECYGEQGRYVDLRRTKQLIRYNVEFNTNTPNAAKLANVRGEYKWYRPIPQLEFDNNTALTSADQNPGY